MAHTTVNIGDVDGLYRRVGDILGVRAFGFAALALPPNTQQVAHYHERQDEVYLIHAGHAAFEVDGETFECGPGTVVHVESTTPRTFWNIGAETVVIVAVGGCDGAVDGDGRLVDDADADRLAALLRGDVEGIRRA